MLSAGRHSTYVNYMRRFFRPCTEQGYKRVTNGNKLGAMANDEWDFQIDPARVGESIGLWRADLRGGNWQRIKTSSSSWSNQGLRYYKGLAWYRQTVELPADFTGRRTFLWCGGVDEKAKVWINGKPIGISPGAAFSPFEMDATEPVHAGKNVITLCVANEVVNELGTGGIVAPVMLYAPAAGKDARPENVRPLGETFP
jgi:beta-galactosidase/beta-glucuronidase